MTDTDKLIVAKIDQLMEEIKEMRSDFNNQRVSCENRMTILESCSKQSSSSKTSVDIAYLKNDNIWFKRIGAAVWGVIGAIIASVIIVFIDKK